MGSTNRQLKLLQERIDATVPQPWLISLPALPHRFLVPAWHLFAMGQNSGMTARFPQ